MKGNVNNNFPFNNESSFVNNFLGNHNKKQNLPRSNIGGVSFNFTGNDPVNSINNSFKSSKSMNQKIST